MVRQKICCPCLILKMHKFNAQCPSTPFWKCFSLDQTWTRTPDRNSEHSAGTGYTMSPIGHTWRAGWHCIPRSPAGRAAPYRSTHTYSPGCEEGWTWRHWWGGDDRWARWSWRNLGEMEDLINYHSRRDMCEILYDSRGHGSAPERKCYSLNNIV